MFTVHKHGQLPDKKSIAQKVMAESGWIARMRARGLLPPIAQPAIRTTPIPQEPIPAVISFAPASGYQEQPVEPWTLVDLPTEGRLPAPPLTQLYIFNVLLGDQNPTLAVLEELFAQGEQEEIARWINQHLADKQYINAATLLIVQHDLPGFYTYLFNQVVQLGQLGRGRDTTVTPWDVTTCLAKRTTPSELCRLLVKGKPGKVLVATNTFSKHVDPWQLHTLIETERTAAAAQNRQPVVLLGGVNLARTPNYQAIWLPMAQYESTLLQHHESGVLSYFNHALQQRINLAPAWENVRLTRLVPHVITGEVTESNYQRGRAEAAVLARVAFPQLMRTTHGNTVATELFP